MGAGFVIFSTLGAGSSYWLFGLATLVTGIGIGLATAPATTAIVSSLPAERQCIASAVNDLTREVGGAFGIAVLGSLLNRGYRADVAPATAGLPRSAAGAVKDSIAAAGPIAERAGAHRATLLAQAQQAFVNGFSTALLAAAGVLFAAGAIVAVLAPPRAEVERSATRPHSGTRSLSRG